MNKLTIPTILMATVLVAGIFAFMPVQPTTTVHLTILGESIELRTVNAAATGLDIDDEDDPDRRAQMP